MRLLLRGNLSLYVGFLMVHVDRKRDSYLRGFYYYERKLGFWFGFLIGMWLYLHFGIKISSSYLSFTTITEFLHWDCVSSDFLVQVYIGLVVESKQTTQYFVCLLFFCSFSSNNVSISMGVDKYGAYCGVMPRRWLGGACILLRRIWRSFLLPRIWQVEGGTCYWFWFGFGEKNIEIPARLAGYTIDWKQREIRVEGTRTTIKSERKSGLFKAGVSRSSPKSPLKSNS